MMIRPSLLFVLFLLVLGPANTRAQDCVFYFPVKVGTVLEMKHFGNADKLESTTYQTVLRQNSKGKEASIDVEMRSVDPKGKELYKKIVPMQCKNGVFVLNVKDFLPEGSKMEGMKGMDMKVTGSDMVVPAHLVKGQSLPDSDMKIKMMNNGMAMMSATTTFTNRKVESIENITTPAGTFMCYKITMDVTVKTMSNMKMKMVQWLSKDFGIVRMENLDNNGKMITYSLLTSIKNG